MKKFYLLKIACLLAAFTVGSAFANIPPEADPNGPYTGYEGSGIALDGTGSSDPDGDPLFFVWDFGDGSPTVEGPTVFHIYDDNFNYDVCLTVNDGQLEDEKCTEASISNVAPTAIFNAPTEVNVGDDIYLSLTNPVDPSNADTTAGFEYAFDCGYGYSSFGSENYADCSTSEPSTLIVGGKIRDKDGGETEYTTDVTVYLPVAVDISPRSCPNPLNVKGRGVITVAILGAEDFDVTQVDPASVKLLGVSPLRWALQDVATPFGPFLGKEDAFADCTELGPDGLLDLKLKFRVQEIVAALGDVSDGDVLVLTVTGNLKEEFNGKPIIGEDVVFILSK